MSFTSIPTLDLSRADDPATKPAFLAELRDALIEVGFFYVKNVGVPDELFQQVIEQGKAFFDIPLEEKLKIEMKNAPSFLGYSRLAAEITAGAVDYREQIDLSTEHAVPGPDAPRCDNLLAPNQWPAPAVLPAFRPAFTEYIARLGDIARRFTALVCEAIGLPATAFERYVVDPDPRRRQHKLKVVRYPDAGEAGDTGGAASRQGVGPHKDSMFTTFLLQASDHAGLQAQNTRGQWIDAPPRPGTLVVVIGQGMEALTQGVCVSTTHRVVSPPAGAGARFSIPFFQGVRLDTAFEDLERIGVGAVPAAVRAQRHAVVAAAGGGDAAKDSVEFTFRTGGAARTLGEATLRNRVKSHPDVGERWYPDILASIRAEQLQQQKEQRSGDKTASVARPDAAQTAQTAPAVPAH